MAEHELLTILEAGRWAPSAFNYQPWRFAYARRDDAFWREWIDLLDPFNRSWAAHASVLLFVLSDTIMNRPKSGTCEPSHSHSFDAGAAWAMMALQATHLGYHAHGMTGIEFDRARARLNVPDRFHIEAAVAIGRLGDPASLPDHLRERETPSDRRPLAELAFRGAFPD